MNDILAKLRFQGITNIRFENGILISCSVTEKKIVIPVGVIALYDGCLSGQNILECVTIPSSVQYCGRSCFANDKNLKEIRIPSSLVCFSSNLSSGNKAKIKIIR